MTEAKDPTKQDVGPPKTDRIGNDFREGPNPNPGGTIDTGSSLIPPYEDRTVGVTPPEELDTPAQGIATLDPEESTPSTSY
jgi:hypothetical protein